jgi:precorrin-6A synthase
MKKVLVIGIGPGNPEQITVQAIGALNRTDVFFVVDKGGDADDLAVLRREICDRYVSGSSYRFVEIPDPPRDRAPASYPEAVADWHHRRAEAFGRAIDLELNDGETGAFLAWGDPSLYDSTVRILDEVSRAGAARFELEVIPGVTSVQALAARHRIPLQRVGEAVHVTTGRNLTAGWPAGAENVVVLLDGSGAFLSVEGDDVEIYWGAYLGTDDEVLVAGPLREVADEIAKLRATARARKGWIMDTYLLRRASDSPADPAANSQ